MLASLRTLLLSCAPLQALEGRPEPPAGDLFGYTLVRLPGADGEALLVGDHTDWSELDARPFAWVVSLPEGELRFAISDDSRRPGSLLSVGDVDGDGWSDFACLRVGEGPHAWGPVLEVRSGADGSTLAGRALAVDEVYDSFYGRLRGPSFQGLQPVPEFLLIGSFGCHDGWRWELKAPQPDAQNTRLWVLSAKDLAPRLVIDAPRGEPDFVTAIWLDDEDGDGFAEIAVVVGEPQRARGEVRILSGADGRVLREASASEHEWHSPELAVGHDYDGDGSRDLLVLGRKWTRRGDDTLEIGIHSGRTAELLAIEALPLRALDEFVLEPLSGVELREPSLLLCAHGKFEDGYGVLLSREDLRPSLHVRGRGRMSDTEHHFGFSALGLCDLDGDGLPEFAVGAASPWSAVHSKGSVQLFSGADGRRLRRFLRANLAQQLAAAPEKLRP